MSKQAPIFISISSQGGAMKTKTIPTGSNAALSLVPSKESRTVNAGFPYDFQDLCLQAMDRAIGIEKASLATVVGLNSSAVDIYKNAFRFAPVFGELLDATAKSFTLCIELQMNWLTMMVPHASRSGGQAEPPAEELAHSMDIAIGERDTTQSNAVTSNSYNQAKPTEEIPERSMGIAMRARA
jgi:hypothetical protein